MGNESSAAIFRFSPAAAGGQAGKPQSSAQTLTPSSFPARETLLLHHMLKLHGGREKMDRYFHPKPVAEPGGEAHHTDSEMAAASPGCLFSRSILSGNKAGLSSASPKKGGERRVDRTSRPNPKSHSQIPPYCSPSLLGLSQPSWEHPMAICKDPWLPAGLWEHSPLPATLQAQGHLAAACREGVWSAVGT